MNERQLSGLSLDLPRGPCQGSTDGSASAVLGVQRRDLDPGAIGTIDARGRERAPDDQRLRRAAAGTSAPDPESKLGCARQRAGTASDPSCTAGAACVATAAGAAGAGACTCSYGDVHSTVRCCQYSGIRAFACRVRCQAHTPATTGGGSSHSGGAVRPVRYPRAYSSPGTSSGNAAERS